MNSIKEPTQLMTSSEVVELVEVFQAYAQDNRHLYSDKEYEEIYHRFDWHYQKAAKNLRKFNRRTMQDS